MFTKILAFIKLIFGFSITVKEFKDLIVPVAARNWHYVFELILNKYDPSISLAYSNLYQEKEFINEGRGSGILKPNRVLSSSKGKIFEKIFFNDSPGLSRNLGFTKKFTKHLAKKHIVFPEIMEILNGDKLTVVLFEYLDLVRIPEGDEYDILKAATLNMFHSPKKGEARDKILYDRFNIGKERLGETGVFSEDELLKLNAIVKSTPVYFQHFDLKEDNVFMGNVIVDWDNSGNYHLGADFGVLLLSLFTFEEKDFLSKYKIEIKEYYSKIHINTPYDLFYLTVLSHFINLFHGRTSSKTEYIKILPVIKDVKAKLRGISSNSYNPVEY